MQKTIDYCEGYSLDYLIHALFICVGAFFLGIYYLFPAIMIAIFAILLLFVKSGIEIDVSKKLIREYKSIFNFKLGPWLEVMNYRKILLKYTRESQVMNSRGRSTSVNTRTFDLILIDENEVETPIYEFSKYKMAMRVCRQLEYSFNMVIKDEYKEMRKRADQFNTKNKDSR